jgi:hypothetical protein
MSLDLPPAPSSSSPGRQTFLQLRHCLLQVARPPYGFVVDFGSSEDLISDFVLLAPSFCNFASYALVDGRMPMAWLKDRYGEPERGGVNGSR